MNQELSLKVLRLSKPSFLPRHHNFFQNDPALFGTDALKTAIENDPTSDLTFITPVNEPKSLHGNEEEYIIATYGLAPVLSLPTTFGNIYLGEQFSCFISINNECLNPVYDIGIKTELQTATQRFTLTDTVGTLQSSPTNLLPTQLPPGQTGRVKLLPTQSTDCMINHEVKELGAHILVCSVHYTAENEKKYFRKFFKFQVLNPLAVKTKVNSMPNNKVLLEVQIQNCGHCVLNLNKIKFEASEVFRYMDLNTVLNQMSADGNGDAIKNETEEVSVFGESPLMNIGDIRQYLYLLEPAIPDDRIAICTPSLGKLDIGWKSAMGQSGRLQTAMLSRKVASPPLFEIRVVSWPESMYIEEPFKLLCEVINHHHETVRMTLSGIKSNMGSVLLSGPSEMMLGNIQSTKSVLVELIFFPLHPGLHRISGLQLSDAISGQVLEIDHLIDVFIYDLETV